MLHIPARSEQETHIARKISQCRIPLFPYVDTPDILFVSAVETSFESNKTGE